MPTILLVRHAQGSFGSDDYDVLSPTGVEQAETVAAALARRELNVTRILTGPARRHRDTAAPISAALGPAADVDDRLDEYPTDAVVEHHSRVAVSLDGTGAGGEPITSHEFQRVLDDALSDWVGSGAATGVPQSWPDFVGSRRAAIGDLAASLSSGEVGVAITSGGAIAAIAADLLGHHDLFVSFNRVLVNTGITKIVVGRAGTSLIALNDHAHIDDGGGQLLSYR